MLRITQIKFDVNPFHLQSRADRHSFYERLMDDREARAKHFASWRRDQVRAVDEEIK